MSQLLQPPVAAQTTIQTSIGAKSFAWVERPTALPINLGAIQLSEPWAPVLSSDGLRVRVDSGSAQLLVALGYQQSGNQGGINQPSVPSNTPVQTSFGVVSFVWVEKIAGGAISPLQLTSGFNPIYSGDGLRGRIDAGAATPDALAKAAYRISANQADS